MEDPNAAPVLLPFPSVWSERIPIRALSTAQTGSRHQAGLACSGGFRSLRATIPTSLAAQFLNRDPQGAGRCGKYCRPRVGPISKQFFLGLIAGKLRVLSGYRGKGHLRNAVNSQQANSDLERAASLHRRPLPAPKSALHPPGRDRFKDVSPNQHFCCKAVPNKEKTEGVPM